MKNKDLTRYSDIAKAKSPNTAPYPMGRLAPTIELVNLAAQISQADSLIVSHANAKLTVIADQIRTLQEEARRVLEQAELDQALHRVKCNFQRQPGRIYHLYERESGERYFSMLSPQDWGTAPHAYKGAYRLENDQSWTLVDPVDG